MPVQAGADISTVAHVIQQAVAPVFLLTGVGGLLAVLTNRLARIVDRLRALKNIESDPQRQKYASEMLALSLRATWAHRAITLCTVCALLICIVVATLFIGSQFGVDSSTPIATLFITAMLSLISGLLCFLREIALATRNIDQPANACKRDSEH